MSFEIKRTELVWPGKYDEEGNLNVSPRVNLPFQVIERINETRATREARENQGATLFDVWQGEDEGDTFEDGWRNKLIWGDNKLIMDSLLDQFKGKIDLIYIDPPFAVGSDFSISLKIGDEKIDKEASLIEEVAYRDTWGKGQDSYLNMIFERLITIRELLSEQGVIYLHCDWRLNSNLRLMLDEIFGPENFQNEIIWGYKEAINSTKRWNRKHDNIFFYSKSQEFVFNSDAVLTPHSESTNAKYRYEDENGPYRLMGRGIVGSPIQSARDVDPKWEKTNPELVYRHYKRAGTLPIDWWDLSAINQASKERLGYPTQKPETLLEKIILASSNEGDLVADFFCGSGTTLAVAEKLGRRWIGADLGRFAVHTTRKRILEIEDAKPFEILNLGKYERQHWSSAQFGEDTNEDGKIDYFEYIKFILKLYKAEALSGGTHLHGRRGKTMVRVGSVSSPVTFQEVQDAVDECKTVGAKELHVLGWEWEMNLHSMIDQVKNQYGIKLVLNQIPREAMEDEAVKKDHIEFYELAYVECEIKDGKPAHSKQIVLEDFVISNPELVPEKVREKIKKWSDYINYWAIDWDFKNDTFMSTWMTYRTNKDNTLSLKSDVHTYEKPGTYQVMIKVIDVFGNDTSVIREVKVK